MTDSRNRTIAAYEADAATYAAGTAATPASVVRDLDVFCRAGQDTAGEGSARG